ncbi:MAG: hypothetical protein ACRC1J_11185 [Sandaracinobacteroides sp.]
MTTIRTILLVLLIVALTLFSVVNNRFVFVNFGFQEFRIWLPLLVVASFALGFLPVWLRLSADRLILKRKLAKLEASLGHTETELAQAKVELLRPPGAPMPAVAQSIPCPAPPPGT